eukprot:TRINITY_DN7806_c0_g1_i1.p1 TRINITY_DN7806_c0_g1~~TRINITY_DN7806_c0_g1_i1.p1  ORF type:complete len:201 (-),score=42.71 TRINITY_DN7806_c0_g1_i1:60-662(-)
MASNQPDPVLVDLLTRDTETDVFLKRSFFKFTRKAENLIYLGGRISGTELNQIATEIERRIDGCCFFKVPCFMLILSLLSFVAFIVGIVIFSNGNSNVKLMFVPLIAFMALFFTAIFWAAFASCKANERIRLYLDELNNTSLGPRGMIASVTSQGLVRFSVSAGQYMPVNIPTSYYPANNNYQFPQIVPGARQGLSLIHI